MSKQTGTDNLSLIRSLIDQAEGIIYNEGQVDSIIKRGQMLLRKFFNNDPHYIKLLNAISFRPQYVTSHTTELDRLKAFELGKKRLLTLLHVIEEDLTLTETSAKKISSPTVANNKNVFIVHGHNVAVQQSVARTIELLSLNPIILSDQPNQGRTVIEKFEAHSEVGFVVVLLTDDDEGRLRNASELKPRARQNVMLELGYFMGKLGRTRVLPLYIEGVELPTDIHGLLYTVLDKHDSWKYKLVKELRAAGYEVDANAI